MGWKLAGKRRDATPVPVERSGLDGQSLPFPDDSFDTALSTQHRLEPIKVLGDNSLGVAQSP